MPIKDALEYMRSLQTWRARFGYALAILSKRAGLPTSTETRFMRMIYGSFNGAAGVFDLRRDTLDANTVHPGHERETHAELRAFLRRDGGTMLDVGGHCGSFGLRYRRRFDRIFIFEPFPENADAIERNVSLSGVAGKVSLVRAAVSATEGRRELYLASDDTHSLVPDRHSRSIVVDTVTLDAYLSRVAAPLSSIRLLKIDVEGAEVGVLEGAREMLAKSRPLIVAEANTDAALRQLQSFLEHYGYRLHKCADGRNAIFISPGDHERQ